MPSPSSVKWGTNIQVLAITDNVIPHEKRIGDNLLTSYFVKSCDGFVTLSASVLDDLSKFTNCSNKQFIPHPIYDVFGSQVEKSKAQQYLGLNPAEKHLLFFGFVRKYKGLDILIKAAQELKKKIFDHAISKDVMEHIDKDKLPNILNVIESPIFKFRSLATL